MAHERGDIRRLEPCSGSANGCPWDKSVWIEAVRYGHTDMLRWAIANGCPISDVELETLRRRTGESLIVAPR